MIFIKRKPKSGKRKLKLRNSNSDYMKAADDLISLYIREAADWKCARCGKQHNRGSGRLTHSHYIARDDKRFRYDLNNGDPLCWMPCHTDWESRKNTTYKKYKIEQLGLNYVEAMEKISLSSSIMDIDEDELKKLPPGLYNKLFHGKTDYSMEYLYWKEMYGKLCAKKGVQNLWEGTRRAKNIINK